jgi:pseudouridine-5'-phosphate glycosidase
LAAVRSPHVRKYAPGCAFGRLELAARSSITGKNVTPFLLDHFHRTTHGLSMQVNERIILSNAALAAEIAVAYQQ